MEGFVQRRDCESGTVRPEKLDQSVLFFGEKSTITKHDWSQIPGDEDSREQSYVENRDTTVTVPRTRKIQS